MILIEIVEGTSFEELSNVSRNIVQGINISLWEPVLTAKETMPGVI